MTFVSDLLNNHILHCFANDLFREKYIPITRRSMVRHLMQEEKMLTEEEVEGFESFALALDSAIVNRYHGLLQELKVLTKSL